MTQALELILPAHLPFKVNLLAIIQAVMSGPVFLKSQSNRLICSCQERVLVVVASIYLLVVSVS